jgi:UDP-N-acetyl-D-mannosaminuronate dehydrogenase
MKFQESSIAIFGKAYRSQLNEMRESFATVFTDDFYNQDVPALLVISFIALIPIFLMVKGFRFQAEI